MIKKISPLLFILSVLVSDVVGFDSPGIFPIPQKVELTGGRLTLDSQSLIVVSKAKSETNILITELLSAEFGDKYRIPINIIRANEPPPNQKYILIGTLNDPLIKEYCKKNMLTKKVIDLGEEGYLLLVNDHGVVIASKNDRGVIYGFQSFRQLLQKKNNEIFIPQILVEDKPRLPFRAIRLYMPGRDNITFFKRFVRDFMSKYKYNTVILEFNANMRLESHPELNIGTLKFGEDLNFSRRGRPSGPHNEYQNSSHHDNADGGILEKSEIADLMKYIRRFNIEIIPEIPSLTHAYYLLFGKKKSAEIPNREYPDTYCPLRPENYINYFDVLNEYIKVIQPTIIHVGHDEWRMEKDVCELCKGKDYGKLFADDLNKIHDFLEKKGIRTAIWGDHLLESVREKYHRVWETSSGYKYNIPGALTQSQVVNLIPKNILILNWFWNKSKDQGPDNDIQLSDLGFEQIYGNLRPEIIEWDKRKKIKGMLGGAPSSWTATTENNFGKDLMYDFLGCANLLWSNHLRSPEQMASISQDLMPQIKEEMSGQVLPSKKELPSTFVNMDAYNNSTLEVGIDSLDVSSLLTGEININGKKFYLNSLEKVAASVYSLDDSKKAKEVKGIKINKDVISLVFLHASVKEALNRKAYKKIYNFNDTAELLGWYEVVYEDGFITTIPIRYGVNILDWNVHNRIASKSVKKTKYAQNIYAYEADLTLVSDIEGKNSINFFAYEWINQRQGEIIKEVNLKAAKFKLNNENAIVLLAITTVDTIIAEDAKGEETE